MTADWRTWTAGLSVCVAALPAIAWFNTPYRTTRIHPDYGVSLASPALAAGWADDIFVGTVTSGGQNATASDGIPMTVFTVTVRKALKGKVTGTINVAQEGGIDPTTRERVVIGDVPALVNGSTYVLATRVSTSGWHTAPSNFVPQLISNDQDSSLLTWQKAVRSPSDTTQPVAVDGPGRRNPGRPALCQEHDQVGTPTRTVKRLGHEVTEDAAREDVAAIFAYVLEL